MNEKEVKKHLEQFHKVTNLEGGDTMKLSQILKIAGSIVGGLALLALVVETIRNHRILVGIIIIGGLAYFAGVWFKKKGK